MMTDSAPKHPGKILFDQVMTPLEVSRNKLARDIDVPVGRISDIVAGKRGITPDTALRFAKYFGTTAELWLRLQADYDLYVARTTTWRDAEHKVAEFEQSGGVAEPSSAPVAENYPANTPAVEPRTSDADETGGRTYETVAKTTGTVEHLVPGEAANADTDPMDREFVDTLSTARPDDEDIDIPEPVTAGMRRSDAL